jgi:hypothetical protein
MSREKVINKIQEAIKITGDPELAFIQSALFSMQEFTINEKVDKSLAILALFRLNMKIERKLKSLGE